MPAPAPDGGYNLRNCSSEALVRIVHKVFDAGDGNPYIMMEIASELRSREMFRTENAVLEFIGQHYGDHLAELTGTAELPN